MWFICVTDPQWWLASYGPQVVLKLPTLMFAVLLVVTVIKGPHELLTPFLTFFVYMVVTLPLSYDRRATFDVTKVIFAYYVLGLATVTLIRQARDAVPFVMLAMLYQFVWWVALGARHGLVPWHYAYSNYDGYGPLMSLGLVCCFYLGMAIPKQRKSLRMLAFLAAGGCIVGLVSSFARGAILGAGAVAGWAWLRSRHKFKTTLLGIGAVGVLFLAANVFFKNETRGESSSFWNEIFSSFNKNDPTRIDRQVIWAAALRVYRDNPIIGVGAETFGEYAADHFSPGQVGGAYAENPKNLWGKRLHNTYYQILSEYGTIGAAIFLWMLVDFFRLNRALRRRERLQAWAVRSGGQLDLAQLSLGLESAMLAWAVTGYFYNLIFSVPWLYALITINTVLYQLSKPDPVAPARRAWR